MSYVMLMTTVGGDGEAAALARALVEARLAACVQRLPVASTYGWDGAIHDSPEVLLLIKTRASLQAAAAARIAELHSYETPEIIATPIAFGAPTYLAWVDAQTLEISP